MTVPLKDGWQNANLCHRPYALSSRDRAVVDHKFDKFAKDGNLSQATKFTPFAFPVFVVWKTSFDDKEIPTRKPRAVIDTRGLNHWTMKDSYPLPAHDDITNSLRGCHYMSVVNAIAFLFQWMVTQANQHHFTVNNHPSQDTFRVALMGFKTVSRTSGASTLGTKFSVTPIGSLATKEPAHSQSNASARSYQ